MRYAIICETIEELRELEDLRRQLEFPPKADEPEAAKPADSEPSEALTLADVQAAVGDFARDYQGDPLEAIKAALSDLGVEKASHLEPSQYATFLAKLEQA